MEKELTCPTLFGMENCYFHPNWDTSMDQNDPFESALSSMVSSPTAASNGGGLIPGDGMMIRELIGRLGSICDSGDISPQSCINSTTTSCYSTPLNSPPKFNLSPLMLMGAANSNFPSANLQNYPPNMAPPFNADPGFVERAAKFSCFGNNNMNSNFSGCKMGNNNLECGKLSRASSYHERKIGGISRASTPENGEMGDSREGSSVSEQNPAPEMGIKAQNDGNSRKRKSIPKSKVKESPSPAANDDKVEAENENEESNAKRRKQENEAKKEKAEQNAAGNSSGNNNKDKEDNDNSKEAAAAAKPEPPKDYIHVRARRGQATDSHSLAERVRREKISERMKFLQDLVPGCNKVTGKATVLDEIINYVQSLQRQVEFLSMKLATVNPRMEFNMEALLSKDMFQSRGTAHQQTMYPLDQNSAQALPFGYQPSQQLPLSMPNGGPNGSENPLSLHLLNAAGIRPNSGIQMPSDGFGDSMTQLQGFWEDDLQSIVQMGAPQNQTQSVPGTLPNAQMKAEL